MTARRSLFDLLAGAGPIVGPGVFDALSAKIARAAGLPMAFLSGYCVSATSLGSPDIGLLGQSEMLAAAERVCGATDMPILVDIDTGYGGPFNVERSVEALVRYGAAGCFLEDQVWPKRCGHMEDKRVVAEDEYLPKLRAALAARAGAPFHVTARTDARSVEGLDRALDRAKAYADAGADAVFVEAPQSVDELERIGRELRGVTLVANMIEHGKTPLLSADELSELGFRLIAWPLTGLMATIGALEAAYGELAASGRAAPTEGRAFAEVNDLLGLGRYREREAELVRANAPRRSSDQDTTR